jgi:hypothetical protein
MFKWWESQIDDECGIIRNLPHIQCVNNPAYLDPKFMPQNMKDDVKIMLDEYEAYLESNEELKNKYMPAIKNIRTNVLDVNIDSNLQQFNWQQMKDFLYPLDKYRKRNILDYLPYMQKYL